MLAQNPLRVNFYRKYQQIIADYNREKGRATVAATFAALIQLANELDEERQRAVREGLSGDELALFDLLRREDISRRNRERLKQASRDLLAALRAMIESMLRWLQNSATQAEIRVHILDSLWQSLPRPPFTDVETETLASRVYDFVWQRSTTGDFGRLSTRNW